MHEYSAQFYEQIVGGATRSARAVVPIVMQALKPRSVVDVGCGTGAWLAVFLEHGVRDVLGVDGAYVDAERLLIPADKFVSRDLAQSFKLERVFDLVLSLEVAEHLSAEAAETFVANLVELGPAVLFSAAIPEQGGENHLNEQWPEYWAEKFERRGYVAVDCIRQRVWCDAQVEPWYAQNTFLYLRRDSLSEHPDLRGAAASLTALLPAVHPGVYMAHAWRAKALSALEQLFDVVPAGTSIALVDENYLSPRTLKPWDVQRLQEREGIYWGPPESDECAAAELERVRRAGAQFLVFAWPAFWWFEHYAAFNERIRARLRCISTSEALVIFDLSDAGGGGLPAIDFVKVESATAVND